MSDDIDQLFELTRILVLVISNHVPNVSEHMSAGKFFCLAPYPSIALVRPNTETAAVVQDVSHA